MQENTLLFIIIKILSSSFHVFSLSRLWLNFVILFHEKCKSACVENNISVRSITTTSGGQWTACAFWTAFCPVRCLLSSWVSAGCCSAQQLSSDITAVLCASEHRLQRPVSPWCCWPSAWVRPALHPTTLRQDGGIWVGRTAGSYSGDQCCLSTPVLLSFFPALCLFLLD